MLTAPQRRILVRMKGGLQLVRIERVQPGVEWRLRLRPGAQHETVRADVGPLLLGHFIEKVPPTPGQPPHEDVYRLTERGRAAAFPPDHDALRLPARAEGEA